MAGGRRQPRWITRPAMLCMEVYGCVIITAQYATIVSIDQANNVGNEEAEMTTLYRKSIY